MITDKVDQKISGVLPDRSELEKFLDTLHLSGLRTHLTKPSEKSFSLNEDGKISVDLHIHESTRFHFMSALKDGGSLSKWGNCFTLD